MEEDDDDDIIPLVPPPLLKVPSSPTRSPSTQRGRASPHVQSKGRASPKPKPHNGASYHSTAAAVTTNAKPAAVKNWVAYVCIYHYHHV